MIRLRPVHRFVRNRIFRVDDDPRRVARGIAVGFFVGFLPLMGIQMVFAFFVAKLCKANRMMAMLSVWISNPVTAVFIYYPCYLLGRLLLAKTGKPLGAEHLQHVFENVFTTEHIFHDVFTAQFWSDAYKAFMHIGLEITLGGIILGAIAAKVGYWVSLVLIQRYRRRKHHFFRRLALRKQQAQRNQQDQRPNRSAG
jgi:uncharacterized protein